MFACVFPGQGSQFKGMGGELFDKYKELTEKAEKILGYSIKELCLKDPNNLLNNTRYTQPALYVVNAMCYLQKIEETSKKPDYVAGHSLGEFNALFAAGVFDFETGLQLVKKRGELMSQVKDGGMAAVIGLEIEQIRKVIKDNNLESLDVANYNSKTQIVVAGPKEDIQNAKKYFENAGALKYVILNVSGAFHSRYMKEKAKEFGLFLRNFKLNEFDIKVISNVTGEVYKSDEIYKNIELQMYSYVKWNDTIKYLLSKNVDEIVQTGPGRVLTSLTKRIKDENSFSVDKNTINEQKDATINIKFNIEYGLKYPYLVSGIERGISSKEMIVKCGKEHILSFLGTKKMNIEKVKESIIYIKERLSNGEVYGVNITYDPFDKGLASQIIDLCLEYEVKYIEISGYMNIPDFIIRYKLKNIRQKNNKVICDNKVFLKTDRLSNLNQWMERMPDEVLNSLVEEKLIKSEERELAKYISIIDAVTINCGEKINTHRNDLLNIIPRVIKIRDYKVKAYNYDNSIYVGAAGNIGTPEAVAISFLLGVDYVSTDLINQCSKEACLSDLTKDLLQQAGIEDTINVPDAEKFEIGGRVQVLKRGVMFPSRANKLYELYRYYESYYQIDEKLRVQMENNYFKKTFDEYFKECKRNLPAEKIDIIEKDEKKKMALVFKQYLIDSVAYGQDGIEEQRMNFSIYCSPSLGAFNEYCLGGELENWRNRSVTKIAEILMHNSRKFIESKVKKAVEVLIE